MQPQPQGTGWVDFGSDSTAAAGQATRVPSVITTSTVISARATVGPGSTYAPQPTGYVPQPTGYQPQQTGYGSFPGQQGQQWPGQNTTYTQQNTGYSQHPGFAQQRPGYITNPQVPPQYTPPRQFPQQQQFPPYGMPPQQFGGYTPPLTASYPPATSQVPQQQSGPAQNIGFTPTQQQYQPQGTGYGIQRPGFPGPTPSLPTQQNVYSQPFPQGAYQQQQAAPYGMTAGNAYPNPAAGPTGAGPSPEQFKATLAAAGAGNMFSGIEEAVKSPPPQQPTAAWQNFEQDPPTNAVQGWTSFDEGPRPSAPAVAGTSAVGAPTAGGWGSNFGDDSAFPPPQPAAAATAINLATVPKPQPGPGSGGLTSSFGMAIGQAAAIASMPSGIPSVHGDARSSAMSTAHPSGSASGAVAAMPAEQQQGQYGYGNQQQGYGNPAGVAPQHTFSDHANAVPQPAVNPSLTRNSQTPQVNQFNHPSLTSMASATSVRSNPSVPTTFTTGAGHVRNTSLTSMPSAASGRSFTAAFSPAVVAQPGSPAAVNNPFNMVHGPSRLAEVHTSSATAFPVSFEDDATPQPNLQPVIGSGASYLSQAVPGVAGVGTQYQVQAMGSAPIQIPAVSALSSQQNSAAVHGMLGSMGSAHSYGNTGMQGAPAGWASFDGEDVATPQPTQPPPVAPAVGTHASLTLSGMPKEPLTNVSTTAPGWTSFDPSAVQASSQSQPVSTAASGNATAADSTGWATFDAAPRTNAAGADVSNNKDNKIPSSIWSSFDADVTSGAHEAMAASTLRPPQQNLQPHSNRTTVSQTGSVASRPTVHDYHEPLPEDIFSEPSEASVVPAIQGASSGNPFASITNKTGVSSLGPIVSVASGTGAVNGIGLSTFGSGTAVAAPIQPAPLVGQASNTPAAVADQPPGVGAESAAHITPIVAAFDPATTATATMPLASNAVAETTWTTFDDDGGQVPPVAPQQAAPSAVIPTASEQLPSQPSHVSQTKELATAQGQGPAAHHDNDDDDSDNEFPFKPAGDAAGNPFTHMYTPELAAAIAAAATGYMSSPMASGPPPPLQLAPDNNLAATSEFSTPDGNTLVQRVDIPEVPASSSTADAAVDAAASAQQTTIQSPVLAASDPVVESPGAGWATFEDDDSNQATIPTLTPQQMPAAIEDTSAAISKAPVQQGSEPVASSNTVPDTANAPFEHSVPDSNAWASFEDTETTVPAVDTAAPKSEENQVAHPEVTSHVEDHPVTVSEPIEATLNVQDHSVTVLESMAVSSIEGAGIQPVAAEAAGWVNFEDDSRPGTAEAQPTVESAVVLTDVTVATATVVQASSDPSVTAPDIMTNAGQQELTALDELAVRPESIHAFAQQTIPANNADDVHDHILAAPVVVSHVREVVLPAYDAPTIVEVAAAGTAPLELSASEPAVLSAENAASSFVTTGAQPAQALVTQPIITDAVPEPKTLEASLLAAEAQHAAQQASQKPPVWAGRSEGIAPGSTSTSPTVRGSNVAALAALYGEPFAAEAQQQPPTPKSRRISNGSAAGSQPLHTWQKDEFAASGSRRSLELGMAAVEAAALARRASSSRSSLEVTPSNSLTARKSLVIPAVNDEGLSQLLGEAGSQPVGDTQLASTEAEATFRDAEASRESTDLHLADAVTPEAALPATDVTPVEGNVLNAETHGNDAADNSHQQQPVPDVPETGSTIIQQTQDVQEQQPILAASHVPEFQAAETQEASGWVSFDDAAADPVSAPQAADIPSQGTQAPAPAPQPEPMLQPATNNSPQFVSGTDIDKAEPEYVAANIVQEGRDSKNESLGAVSVTKEGSGDQESWVLLDASQDAESAPLGMPHEAVAQEQPQEQPVTSTAKVTLPTVVSATTAAAPAVPSTSKITLARGQGSFVGYGIPSGPDSMGSLFQSHYPAADDDQGDADSDGASTHDNPMFESGTADRGEESKASAVEPVPKGPAEPEQQAPVAAGFDESQSTWPESPQQSPKQPPDSTNLPAAASVPVEAITATPAISELPAVAVVDDAMTAQSPGGDWVMFEDAAGGGNESAWPPLEPVQPADSPAALYHELQHASGSNSMSFHDISVTSLVAATPPAAAIAARSQPPQPTADFGFDTSDVAFASQTAPKGLSRFGPATNPSSPVSIPVTPEKLVPSASANERVDQSQGSISAAGTPSKSGTLRRPPPIPPRPPSLSGAAASPTGSFSALSSPISPTKPELQPVQSSNDGKIFSALSAAVGHNTGTQNEQQDTGAGSLPPPPSYESIFGTASVGIEDAPKKPATVPAIPPRPLPRPPPASPEKLVRVPSLIPPAPGSGPNSNTSLSAKPDTKLSPRIVSQGSVTPRGSSNNLPPPPSYESVVGISSPSKIPPPPPYESVVQQSSGQGLTGVVSRAPSTPSYFGFKIASDTVETNALPQQFSLDARLGSQSSAAARAGSISATTQAVLMEEKRGCQGVPIVLDPAHCLDEQLCVEIRPPPMRKGAAVPKLLASGFGSLFAMPALSGSAMLQYAGVDHQISLPEGIPRATQEDYDAAPCGAVPALASDAPITSVLVDEQCAAMWTGHNDGKVSRWAIMAGKGAQLEQSFKAHNNNKVRAMAVTPWGDLWTGSSSGVMRVFGHPGGAPAGRAPTWSSELKRPGNIRAHGKVLAMAPSVSGRVMWSAGTTSLLIWDAHSGTCFGAINLEPDKPRGYTDDSGLLWIDTQQGLSMEAVCREFKARPLSPGSSMGGHAGGMDDGDDDKDGKAAALQTMAKSAIAVGKFAAKIGKKINKTIADARDSRNAGADDSQPSGKSNTDLPEASSTEAGSRTERRDKVKALVPVLDRTMLVVYRSGIVDRYTELGQLLWTRDLREHISCAALVHRFLWLGCNDGYIRMLDVTSGEKHSQWPAHHAPVKSLAVVNGVVLSLGKDGSIRGWPAFYPPNAKFVNAWKEGLRQGLTVNRLNVLAGTWNVNCTKASPASVQEWLTRRAKSAGIVCVGLQEVEMGSASVALDAARSVLSRAALEKGTTAGQWWADTLFTVLNNSGAEFTRIALRQMSGILIVVFAQNHLLPFIGEVVTDNVACGLMGVAGNKGATAVSLTLYRRRLVFLSSHFAAHQEKVDERNADYAKIVRALRFNEYNMGPKKPRTATQQAQNANNNNVPGASNDRASSSNLLDLEEEPLATVSDGIVQSPDVAAATGSRTTPQGLRKGSLASTSSPNISDTPLLANDVLGMGLLTADAVIWMGDFNYRVAATYEWVINRVVAGKLNEATVLDQAHQEMVKGVVFHGLAEGPINFPPTYKYDKGVLHATPGDGNGYTNGQDPVHIPHYGARLLPYDSSERRRVPAWTDRIFYRGSLPKLGSHGSSPEDVTVSLARRAADSRHPDGPPPSYGTILEICDSDHKPVYAQLEIELPVTPHEYKLRHSMQVLASLLDETRPKQAPSLRLDLPSSQQINQKQGSPVRVMKLVGKEFHDMRLTNTGNALLMYSIGGDGNPGRRLPAWLDVSPTSGMLAPGASMTVQLRGGAPSESGFGAGFTAAMKRDTALQIYCQHVICVGSGQLLNSGQQQPILLRVVHHLQ